MSDIKLIGPDTNIDELKMDYFPWDVEVYGVPYQVVRIEDYIHSIGGNGGNNNLWMYPRDSKPTYENLVEYSCKYGACWGINYQPHNYIRTKWGESESFTTGGAMITRNGKDFYFCWGGIDEARCLITKINEHPLDLNFYRFDQLMIGRKVWYRSQPAIIKRWIGNGQACVILEPEGADRFITPPEFADDEIMHDEDSTVKIDIFSEHIWWFRN